mmetsp:Transcript_24803/g.72561  ORF Transcript_24803/g.72561 Transcript_24803/m.72561 type:complete len:283 (+) Transcript_24803:1586-2434(+)
MWSTSWSTPSRGSSTRRRRAAGWSWPSQSWSRSWGRCRRRWRRCVASTSSRARCCCPSTAPSLRGSRPRWGPCTPRCRRTPPARTSRWTPPSASLTRTSPRRSAAGRSPTSRQASGQTSWTSVGPSLPPAARTAAEAAEAGTACGSTSMKSSRRRRRSWRRRPPLRRQTGLQWRRRSALGSTCPGCGRCGAQRASRRRSRPRLRRRLSRGTAAAGMRTAAAAGAGAGAVVAKSPTCGARSRRCSNLSVCAAPTSTIATAARARWTLSAASPSAVCHVCSRYS